MSLPEDVTAKTVLKLKPGRTFDPSRPAWTRSGIPVPTPFLPADGEWDSGHLKSTVDGLKRCWLSNGGYMYDGSAHDFDLFNTPLDRRPGSALPRAA